MYNTEHHHRAVEAQGRYTRRSGEIVELPNDDADGFVRWRILDVVRGDDDAPVTLQDVGGTRIITMPASRLHRFETAMRKGSALDNAPHVVSVDDIPSEQEVVSVPESSVRVLERLRHLELYMSDGTIASVFPREIDRAVRKALAA